MKPWLTRALPVHDWIFLRSEYDERDYIPRDYRLTFVCARCQVLIVYDTFWENPYHGHGFWCFHLNKEKRMFKNGM